MASVDSSEQQLFLAILKMSGEFFIFQQDGGDKAHKARETMDRLPVTLPNVHQLNFFSPAVCSLKITPQLRNWDIPNFFERSSSFGSL